MKLSLLVPTLGEREKEMERLYRSLEDQTYADFEVILVTQGNHERMKALAKEHPGLDIKQVAMDVRGLSRARNRGLKEASGQICLLSDDDCWYPKKALEMIADTFAADQSVQILLTRIYDPEKKNLYKRYSDRAGYIANRLQLMSRSSIELAFRRDIAGKRPFDERLGLGSEFVCGEEIDFLLRNFGRHRIYYRPLVTVYHRRKAAGSSKAQILAKGAVYGKNFPPLIWAIVLLRDLLLKRENNIRLFFEGYHEYIQGKN